MQPTDLYYIDKILSGETNAFVILVDRYKNMVFTIINRIVKNRMEAEEITQDVFLKIFQSLQKFKKKSKFSTWIYKIAYNTAISKTRKKHIEMSALDEMIIENYTFDEIVEEVDKFGLEEKTKFFENALKKIPEEDSLLLTMFYMEEQTIEEISEICNLSATNVKVKLHRIRKKLYQNINEIMKYRYTY